ncbi:MAG: putative sulfate exporter family transporter [Actinobacteria bacterium]|nr:putative sulfate exporter family transporter [Actinomycetota bacterium]
METEADQVGSRWRDLYRKEDWWAVWVGVGLTAIAVVLFETGATSALTTLATSASKLQWTHLSQVGHHFVDKAGVYAVAFVFWALILGVTSRIMGVRLSRFLPAFAVVFVLSAVIFAVSGWKNARTFNLEAPLVALLVGLLLANTVRLPQWMDDGFRVEYFIKVGIVLLGAGFPITLVLTAGPVALLQATIISLATCLLIYWVGTRVFKLDRRLCAVLGVGGAVCGVSAAMAIASSVRAKREHVLTTVSLVVGWALVMIVALPLVSRWIGLSAGVAGAWIGTSEFADAAGLAAATSYGHTAGNEQQAVQAFTLMKVIGRDMWIGIWAIAFALISTMSWEHDRAAVRRRVHLAEIWWRFPKFVFGFFLASIAVTLITNGYPDAEFTSKVKPGLVDPLNAVRTWAFVFCFLSIGLTTRLRELRGVTRKEFATFTSGVGLNVVLGFVLSVMVFGSYWAAL